HVASGCLFLFFFSSRRRYTSSLRDWSSDVCSSDLAPDRSRTIQVAIDPRSEAENLVQPGHVFPLRAREGGVLMRAGQTEAAVDRSEERRVGKGGGGRGSGDHCDEEYERS